MQADCGTSDPSSSPGSVRPSIHRPKVNRPARHALRVETTKSSIESSSVLLDNPNDDLKETINYTNNYTKGSNLSPEYCSRPRRVKVTISKIKSGLNGKTSLKVEHVTDICARDSLNNIWQNSDILLLKRQIYKGNQCLTQVLLKLNIQICFSCNKNCTRHYYKLKVILVPSVLCGQKASHCHKCLICVTGSVSLLTVFQALRFFDLRISSNQRIKRVAKVFWM